MEYWIVLMKVGSSGKSIYTHCQVATVKKPIYKWYKSIRQRKRERKRGKRNGKGKVGKRQRFIRRSWDPEFPDSSPESTRQ